MAALQLKFPRLARTRAMGWTAVVIQPDRVDLAHVRRVANGRPALVSCESFRMDQPVARTLEILRRKLGLDRQRCITTLDHGEYQILQVESPQVPADEIRQALRWRIKDLIEYPPEAATIDYADMPSEQRAGPAQRMLHVVSARSERVRARMQLFEAAGIALSAIDVPEMGLRNVAILCEKPGRALALIRFGESGATLVIVASGELFATRHIDVSAGDLLDPDETRRNAMLDRVALELQRSFDQCDRQLGAVPLERLVVSAPEAPGFLEHLRAALFVPIDWIDLAAVMDIAAVPALADPAQASQALVAIGLALRGEEAAS